MQNYNNTISPKTKGLQHKSDLLDSGLLSSDPTFSPSPPAPAPHPPHPPPSLSLSFVWGVGEWGGGSFLALMVRRRRWLLVVAPNEDPWGCNYENSLVLPLSLRPGFGVRKPWVLPASHGTGPELELGIPALFLKHPCAVPKASLSCS